MFAKIYIGQRHDENTWDRHEGDSSLEKLLDNVVKYSSRAFFSVISFNLFLTAVQGHLYNSTKVGPISLSVYEVPCKMCGMLVEKYKDVNTT